MLQARSRDAISRGDMRWYSVERDVANIFPKVLRSVFLRCDPDRLAPHERELMHSLGITNEDLCEVSKSIACLLKIMRYGQIDPRCALELLGVLSPEDGDKQFQRRDKTLEQIEERLQDNPLFDYTNMRWCISAGITPNKAYLVVGMIFFQEMLLTFIDAYRQTVHPGEDDPNALELRKFYEMLSPERDKQSWWKRIIARLYWRTGNRYRL